VIIQEASHDRLYDGTEYSSRTWLTAWRRSCQPAGTKASNLHPGTAHIQHAVDDLGEEAVWSLNTDAHIRSGLVGRSETIRSSTGAGARRVRRVYFVDFDGVRERDRSVHFTVMGE